MNFRSDGTVELAFDGKICADTIGRKAATPQSSQNTVSKKLMVKLGRAIGRSHKAGGKTGTNAMRRV